MTQAECIKELTNFIIFTQQHPSSKKGGSERARKLIEAMEFAIKELQSRKED